MTLCKAPPGGPSNGVVVLYADIIALFRPFWTKAKPVLTAAPQQDTYPPLTTHAMFLRQRDCDTVSPSPTPHLGMPRNPCCSAFLKDGAGWVFRSLPSCRLHLDRSMNDPLVHPTRVSGPTMAPRVPVGLTLAILLLVTSCQTKRPGDHTALPPTPPSRTFDAVETFYATHKDLQDKLIERKHVYIEGDDILLPETTQAGKAGERSYLFDVWVHHPRYPEKPAEELLKSGELSIEVIGTHATLRRPGTHPGAPEVIPPDSPYASRKKVGIEIKSEDIVGPFTILAWFPNEYMMTSHEDRNKWQERRDVRIYYGDIKARVQIVSDEEAQASFGEAFAKLWRHGGG